MLGARGTHAAFAAGPLAQNNITAVSCPCFLSLRNLQSRYSFEELMLTSDIAAVVQCLHHSFDEPKYCAPGSFDKGGQIVCVPEKSHGCERRGVQT